MKLDEAIRRLTEAGIDNPSHDARVIFSELGGLARHALALRDASSDDPKVALAIERRAGGEPLQYIIGRVGFYREEYLVSPDCLIPREDTEILVDYAVRSIPRGGRFIDLCTGSGCIAISTLKNTEGTTATAVDISPAALAIARRNAEANGVGDRLSLVTLDLMERGEELLADSYDAVLSNPPYVSEEEYACLAAELTYEPRIALTDGGDGSAFYRRLVPLAAGLVREGGFIAMEIGSTQGELLSMLAKECGLSCSILRDLSGRQRTAVMRRL